MDLSLSGIIAGIFFGGIGFVAFVYGKKTGTYRPMFLGLALIVFPYFIQNTIALYSVGAVLTVALFFP